MLGENEEVHTHVNKSAMRSRASVPKSTHEASMSSLKGNAPQFRNLMR